MIKKTIGIITAHYLPHLGGVERYVYNFASTLTERGYQVIIITSQLNGMAETQENPEGYIYRLPCLEFMNGRMPVVKLNKQFKNMVHKLNNINFDFILLNTRLYTLSSWGASYCKRRKVPFMLLEHGTAHMKFANKLLNPFGEVYEHILTGYIKRRCKKFCGVSQECNKWLQHFHIQATDVLYNAVNEEDYRNVSKHFRKKYNIPTDAVILAFVGRLIPEKGILKLLAAFEKIQSQNSSVYMMIAGNGELESEVRRLSGEHVIMLGNLQHEDVISLLTETDIYCLPTDYPEGFPTAILEAAMCRCCIVATNAGGTRELITSDEFGCTLKENSIQEIEMLLSILLKDKERIKRLGNNAQERVKTNFTWTQTIDRFEKILEDIEV